MVVGISVEMNPTGCICKMGGIKREESREQWKGERGGETGCACMLWFHGCRFGVGPASPSPYLCPCRSRSHKTHGGREHRGTALVASGDCSRRLRGEARQGRHFVCSLLQSPILFSAFHALCVAPAIHSWLGCGWVCSSVDVFCPIPLSTDSHSLSAHYLHIMEPPAPPALYQGVLKDSKAFRLMTRMVFSQPFINSISVCCFPLCISFWRQHPASFVVGVGGRVRPWKGKARDYISYPCQS